MRTAVLVLLASSCAFAGFVDVEHYDYKVVGKDWLKWQQDVFDLFKYSHQTSFDKDHLEIAKTWEFEDHFEYFTNVTHIKYFLELYEYGFLPKGAVFSVFYKPHLKEAIALFKVFYYAKDFDTFYKSAAWARNHVNEAMFVYAFSVAVAHREDTHGMVLPPIYEVWPYYFFSSGVIKEAQKYKQLYYGDKKYNEQYIEANYTGWYLNVHPEQSMSYFTEDIGLNSYYYYYNIYYPFWFGGEGFKYKYQHRGEQFYYFYKQLIARYYLERLSNGFGEIPLFDYEQPFEVGYYPSLHYHNGLAFPERSDWTWFFKNYYFHGEHYAWKDKFPYSFTYVKDYERRIRDAIDQGYVYSDDGQKIKLYEQEGFEILGNLIQSNPDSPNNDYYGPYLYYARHLLGNAEQPLDKYKFAPSALQHFETSLRDPAFWMLYKRMTLYFYKYKSHLPPYSYSDLYFPGVKIEDMQVSRLITYFEDFDVDISNSVYMNHHDFETDDFSVYATQERLNHKPFTYKLFVTSEKPTKAVVRVFFGPYEDEYDRPIPINENRHHFVEFDKFVYELSTGKNVIERNSEDFFFADDYTTFDDMYEYVEEAYNGKFEYQWLNGSDAFYGFPERLLLPKGDEGGQKYQFYAIVSPYYAYSSSGYKDTQYWYPTFSPWTHFVDNYPLGFPFDRPINEYYFNVTNSYFYEVDVYHKEYDDVFPSHH